MNTSMDWRVARHWMNGLLHGNINFTRLQLGHKLGCAWQHWGLLGPCARRHEHTAKNPYRHPKRRWRDA